MGCEEEVRHANDEWERLSLLYRISFAATRAVNRDHGVGFADASAWDDELKIQP
jgi:hypothetical protein